MSTATRDIEQWASYPDVLDLAHEIAGQLCAPHHHCDCMVNFFDGDDECNCEVLEEVGLAIVSFQNAKVAA